MSATEAVPVVEPRQLRAWNGGEGAYWAANADYYDRDVALHHRALLDAPPLAATSVSSTSAAARPDDTRHRPGGVGRVGPGRGPVRGDARLRPHAPAAEGLTNVDFRHGDAQIYPFDAASFDVAVSRTGTTFFGNMDAAFANVARALRAAGRIALLTWQPLPGNEWITSSPARSPLAATSQALELGRQGRLRSPNPIECVRSSPARAPSRSTSRRSARACGLAPTPPDAHRFVLGQLGWMVEGLDDTRRARPLDR